MTSEYILSIDQGTTSSRALLIDRHGAVAGTGQVPVDQIYPEPGWVEHDPEQIWRSTVEAIDGGLAASGANRADIAAIGIANQRETLVVWERKTGTPVHNAIVWQDRRTSARCAELREAGHGDRVATATGLTIDPYFTAPSLAWLLDATPGLRERGERGEVLAGTVDSWLAWKLTGGESHVTDFSNASRTLLFNIRKGRWDDSLCELFGVPRAMLPKVRPSASAFGVTTEAAFGATVPIRALAGDQQSALVGQRCAEPGQAKCTYGTGAFVLTPAGRRPLRSDHGLLVSLGAGAGAQGPEYVLEGSVFSAGAAVEWLHEGLGIIGDPDEVEALAAAVPDAGGVSFVPAFTGLGAPHWVPDARGTLLGLTRGTGREHIARAALEAVALSVADVIEAMEADLGSMITELRVDGGAARNDLLMQMQADLLGVPVVRPANVETTAMGAAYLAGLGAGWWDEVTLAGMWQDGGRFEPAIDPDARASQRDAWRRAVAHVVAWSNNPGETH